MAIKSEGDEEAKHSEESSSAAAKKNKNRQIECDLVFSK